MTLRPLVRMYPLNHGSVSILVTSAAFSHFDSGMEGKTLWPLVQLCPLTPS